MQGVPRRAILREIGELLSMELSLLEESVSGGLVNSSTLGVFGVGQNPDKSETEHGRRALSIKIVQITTRFKRNAQKRYRKSRPLS